MRRLFTVMVVATTTCLVPLLALGGNQEVANEIAANLRKTSELTGQRIAVKYQNGTAWLQGELRSQQQIDQAVKVTKNTPKVEQVISELSLRATKTAPKMPNLSIPKLQIPTVSALTKRAAGTPKRGVLVTPAAPYSQEVSAPKAAPAPIPIAMLQDASAPVPAPAQAPSAPVPMYTSAGSGVAPAQYDQPHMPNYSWPSYAAHPNYATLTYPKQYSPTAWPFIGPFYPYPQVPLGWRKVVLEWDDGWWFLDFIDAPSCCLRP